VSAVLLLWGLGVGRVSFALWESGTGLRPSVGDSPRASRIIPPVGERLSYLVSWANFLTAGQLTTEVKGRGRFFDREGLHLALAAESVGVVRVFFPVEDRFTSYVDPVTLLPYRSELFIREGKRTTERVTLLDGKKRLARLSTGRALAIHPETRDLVALFYYLRTLDLVEGKRYRLPAIHAKDRFVLHVSVGQPAEVVVPAGRFEAIELILTVEDKPGEISDAYGLRLWLSRDERRLPVRLSGRLDYGDLRAELVNISMTGGDSQ